MVMSSIEDAVSKCGYIILWEGGDRECSLDYKMSWKPWTKILENSGTLVAVSTPLSNKVAYPLRLLVASGRYATHVTKVTNGPSTQ